MIGLKFKHRLEHNDFSMLIVQFNSTMSGVEFLLQLLFLFPIRTYYETLNSSYTTPNKYFFSSTYRFNVIEPAWKKLAPVVTYVMAAIKFHSITSSSFFYFSTKKTIQFVILPKNHSILKPFLYQESLKSSLTYNCCKALMLQTPSLDAK